MKSFRFFIRGAVAIAMVIGITVSLPVYLSAASVPGWAADAALKFIKNPDEVLYDFHLDNTDYTPVNSDSRLTLRTNFLTSIIPFTWGNLSVKYRAVEERQFKQWVPQIDIAASYSRILALDIASAAMDEEDFSPPSMSDYSVGVIFSKPVTRLTKLQAGFHYSSFSLDFDFPEPLEVTSQTELSELSISRSDFILVTGIVNKIRDDKRMSAYVGYGFNYKKIFSRFCWQYDRLELGFNIYPEGLLVVHPFLGWHWNF